MKIKLIKKNSEKILELHRDSSTAVFVIATIFLGLPILLIFSNLLESLILLDSSSISFNLFSLLVLGGLYFIFGILNIIPICKITLKQRKIIYKRGILIKEINEIDKKDNPILLIQKSFPGPYPPHVFIKSKNQEIRLSQNYTGILSWYSEEDLKKISKELDIPIKVEK